MRRDARSDTGRRAAATPRLAGRASLRTGLDPGRHGVSDVRGGNLIQDVKAA
jgi:hypothetical protein